MKLFTAIAVLTLTGFGVFAQLPAGTIISGSEETYWWSGLGFVSTDSVSLFNAAGFSTIGVQTNTPNISNLVTNTAPISLSHSLTLGTDGPQGGGAGDLYVGDTDDRGRVVMSDPAGNKTAVIDGSTGTSFLFTGNGTGLTNLNASKLTGPVPLANLANAVTNSIVASGSDDTAAFQAAIAAAGVTANGGGFTVISLNPFASYFLSTNICWTNNTSIGCNIGQARVAYLNGATNSMFDVGPLCKNVGFFNMILDGQQYSNYPAVCHFTVWPPQQPEFTAFQSSISNRNALRINCGAGGFVQGITFVGWSGVGLLTYNYNGTEAFKFPRVKISDCIGYTNFCSFYNGDGAWDGIPAYWPTYVNPSSFSRDGAEYQTAENFTAYYCAIGFEWYGGNSKLVNCDVENCLIGQHLDTGSNQQHAGDVGCTLNHNTYGVTALSGLWDFDACQLQANTAWQAIAFDGELLSFRNCRFNLAGLSSGVLVTNESNGVLFSTSVSFDNCDNAIQTPGSFVSINASNCFATGANNISVNGLDDGSLSSGKWTITNSVSPPNVVTTNYSGVNFTTPCMNWLLLGGTVGGGIYIPGYSASNFGNSGSGNYNGVPIAAGTYYLSVDWFAPAVPASTNISFSFEVGNATVMTNCWLKGSLTANSQNVTNSASFTITTNGICGLVVNAWSNGAVMYNIPSVNFTATLIKTH